MSENDQKMNRLPEQPDEPSGGACFLADTGEDKNTRPPTWDDSGEALSDESAVAGHNDQHLAKSAALLENSRDADDSATEDTAQPFDAPEELPAPPVSGAPAPAPLPPAVAVQDVAPVAAEISSGPVETPAPQEPEITVEPTPVSRQRRHKARRVLLTVIPILILAVLLAALTPTVILPGIRRIQAYNAAADLLEAGMHDEACDAFAALGDYRDAPIMALEARYRKADYLSSREGYEAAIAIWLELGSYADSAARAEQAEFDWKDEDYQAAFLLLAQEQFRAASQLFASLGDYQDSPNMAEECRWLQQEADYAAAETALAAGNYAAAIDGFTALGSFADAHDRYLAASYEYGCLLLDEGSYEEAIHRLSDASGYADADGKKIQAYYLYGCALLKDGAYEAAIVQLGKCGDYPDADKQILNAKYGYVRTHMDRSNSTTQSYLKTLISANYYGAQKLYDELYAWKVEIVAYNNSIYSAASTQSTVSKYGPMCIHFKITGGEPGATIDLVGNLTAPNGQNGNIYFSDCKDGDTQCAYFEYYQPAYGATGTMTLRIYDSDGKLMATGSVRVTN